MEKVKIFIRSWWYQNLEEFSTRIGLLSYLACPFAFLFTPDRYEGLLVAVIIGFVFAMLLLPETWLARNLLRFLKRLARIRLFGRK
tara:strand:- start:547 stop:804 length:258 start_codon:yes stop_codon:yes gene_type:complete